MNKWHYSGIALFGVVLGFMEFFVGQKPRSAYLIWFITIYALVSIKFLEELMFYRRHNALLASTQFLVLPFILLTTGSTILPNLSDNTIILIMFDRGYFFSFSLYSLTLTVPISICVKLFHNYYKGYYPALVIRRRAFSPKRTAAIIQLIFISILVLVLRINHILDIFLPASIVLFSLQFMFMLYSAVGSVFRSSPGQRTGRTTSTRVRPPRQFRARSSHNIPTTPRNGYRQISSNQVLRIDEGIDSSRVTKPKSRRKTKSRNSSSNFLPSGHFSPEDLKCIICYEEFDQHSSKNVIICNECKYPAHEDELRSWLTQSSNCPRCNHFVSSNVLKISEKKYSQKLRQL